MTARDTLLNTAAAILPLDLQEVLNRAATKRRSPTGAQLITKHLFPISHRSLEAWPLPHVT